MSWPLQQFDAPEWEVPLLRSEADETAGGIVQFGTMIDTDASTDARPAHEGLYRLFCFYIVNRLSQRALYEACQVLANIYSWQVERTQIANTDFLGAAPQDTRFAARDNLLGLLARDANSLLSETDSAVLAEARAAARRQAKLRKEDIESWADRLAEDLSKFSD
jgi:hypothetical protein